MRIKITGEEPFQIPSAHSMGVSPSNEGYTLQYSVDGINYTDWEEATPANENLFVIGFPKYTFFKLDGNSSDVIIVY